MSGCIQPGKLYKSTATLVLVPAPVGSNPTAALSSLFIEGYITASTGKLAKVARPSGRIYDNSIDATREDKKQSRQEARSQEVKVC